MTTIKREGFGLRVVSTGELLKIDPRDDIHLTLESEQVFIADTYNEAFLVPQQINREYPYSLGSKKNPFWLEECEYVDPNDVKVVAVSEVITVNEVNEPDNLPVVTSADNIDLKTLPFPLVKMYRNGGDMESLKSAHDGGRLYLMEIKKCVGDKITIGQDIIGVVSYSQENIHLKVLSSIDREKLEENRALKQDLDYCFVERFRR